MTTTTEHHDGDSNNPQSLSIECERAQNPDAITCHWTGSTSPDHDKYVLLRITTLNDPGRVMLQSPDALDFTDTMVTAGVGYGYQQHRHDHVLWRCRLGRGRRWFDHDDHATSREHDDVDHRAPRHHDHDDAHLIEPRRPAPTRRPARSLAHRAPKIGPR